MGTIFEGLFQPTHLIVILAIVMIIFGPGKLGDIGSSLGKAAKGFQKSMQEPEARTKEPAGVKKLEEKKE